MKNKGRRIVKAIACSIVFIALTSLFMGCDAFDESRDIFRGGELLDNERLSEIKAEILGTEFEMIESVTGNYIVNETIDDSTSSEKTESYENTSSSDDDNELNTSENETESQVVTYTDESQNITESYSEIAFDTNEISGCETELNENEPEWVYWLENSEKWHLFSDCKYIKGKDFFAGTVENAMESGLQDVCKICKNKSEK